MLCFEIIVIFVGGFVIVVWKFIHEYDVIADDLE